MLKYKASKFEPIHSKLRPNYPTPKIPKNCPRHDIKSGKSPRSGKAREGQKSGCSPASKGARGQKPYGPKIAKMSLKKAHFFDSKIGSNGSKRPQNVSQVTLTDNFVTSIHISLTFVGNFQQKLSNFY